MKIYFKLILILLFILIKQPLSLADQKITFLNLEKILNDTNTGKKILRNLETIKNNNSNNFKKISDEIRSEEEDILKQKNILSEEEFEKKIINLRQEVRRFNDDRNKIIKEFEITKKNELDNFLKKITPFIEKYIAENSVGLVLNQKNIFIADKKYDITNEIIAIVDENLK
tara:strand:- start:35 stop:547 length:513 start_codon:yes stop_codon:yes gene_type:complete